MKVQPKRVAYTTEPAPGKFRVVYPDGHVSNVMTEQEAKDAEMLSRRQYLSACVGYGMMGITKLPGVS